MRREGGGSRTSTTRRKVGRARGMAMRAIATFSIGWQFLHLALPPSLLRRPAGPYVLALAGLAPLDPKRELRDAVQRQKPLRLCLVGTEGEGGEGSHAYRRGGCRKIFGDSKCEI
jgi:hypothetical protein